MLHRCPHNGPVGREDLALQRQMQARASSRAPELAHITLHGDNGPSLLGEEEGHCHLQGTSCGAWCFHVSLFSFLVAQLRHIISPTFQTRKPSLGERKVTGRIIILTAALLVVTHRAATQGSVQHVWIPLGTPPSSPPSFAGSLSPGLSNCQHF